MKIITGKVRASYVNVFQSRFNDLNGSEEFSMMLLIDKLDRATIKKITDAIEDAKTQKWGTSIPKKLYNPLRDGDSSSDLPDSVTPGDAPYAGNYFMNVKNKMKPGIVDAQLNTVIDPSEFQSGDYCLVSLNSYGYDNKKRGVSFSLQNVQVLEKGEPLGISSRAEDDFQVVDPAGSSVDPLLA